MHYTPVDIYVKPLLKLKNQHYLAKDSPQFPELLK